MKTQKYSQADSVGVSSIAGLSGSDRMGYLEAETPTSPYEYALMSQAIYLRSNSSETSEIQCLQAESKLFALGWKKMAIRPSLSSFGYFATTYIHDEKRHVVIAHRGTDPNILQNLFSDAYIAVGAFPAACALSEKYSRKIRSIDGLKKYTFSETGHSLGAIYAEYNAAKVFHCPAVTFDSPGCFGMLDPHNDNIAGIVNYLSAPNLVNTCGQHPQKSIRLFIQHVASDGPSWSDLGGIQEYVKEFVKDTFGNSGQTITPEAVMAKFGIALVSKFLGNLGSQEKKMHSMVNILACFHTEIGLPILQREITEWPTRSQYSWAIANPLNYDLYHRIMGNISIGLIEKNRRHEKFYTSIEGYKADNLLIPALTLTSRKISEWAVGDYIEAVKQVYEEFHEDPAPSFAELMRSSFVEKQVAKMEKQEQTEIQATPQTQQQASYLAQRKQGFQQFSFTKGLLLFKPVQKGIVKPSSSSFPVIPVSALKTTIGLSPAQMELQNQLTKACYDADVDKVKELVEKGADPAISDKDGQQPLAAAIWGLAFKVMDYLESRVTYTEHDWVMIAMDLQTRHNSVIPAFTKIVTYDDWLKHYEAKKCEWFYNFDTCLRRGNVCEVTWMSCYHVTSISASQGRRYVGGNIETLIGVNPRHDYLSFRAPKEAVSGEHLVKVIWIERIYRAMAERLEGRGVKFDENYRLIALSNAPTTRVWQSH